jgi:hypothetical protein
MDAIKPNAGLMRNLALASIREQKIMVPRKTGNLGRSIVIGAVTPTRAETKATASYAAYVERGTKPHIIKPKVKKVLAFPAAGSARLSGSTRSGGQVRFARRVKHPGTKAQPFMLPGAKKAVEGLGLRSVIISSWNDAA